MKDIIEKINVVQLVAAVTTGVALIASVFVGPQEVTLALGTGLVGFLGGIATTTTKGGDSNDGK